MAECSQIRHHAKITQPERLDRRGLADHGQREHMGTVIHGLASLSVALRHRDLRYCDTGEAASVANTRISMLADLLRRASDAQPWVAQAGAGRESAAREP